MKNKIITTLCLLTAIFIGACGGGGEQSATTGKQNEQSGETSANTSSYDPKRGEGKYDGSNLIIGALDATMAEKGSGVANTKCFSCLIFR